MKAFNEILEHIPEELEDAEEYARMALHYKHENRALADMYAELAKQELGHEDMLHSMAHALLAEHPEEDHGWAKHIWEWECGKATDKRSKVKVMLEMYRK